MDDIEGQHASEFWPEALWERFEPYVELGGDELAALLDDMIGRDDLVCHTLLAGGKCNTNYRVELSDGSRLVVRIYERDAQACRRDALITELVSASVTVPDLLARRDDGVDGRPVGVFQWVDGVAPWRAFEEGSAETGAQIGYALGETLAAIGPCKRFSHHGLLDAELGYRRRFDSNRQSFLDLISWSLHDGRAAERLGPDLAGRLERYAHAHAHLLDAVEGEQWLVHGDYKLSNVLVRPEGDGWAVSAVLDWEYAYAGTPLNDLAIMLRHEEAFPAGFGEAFARGFRDGGGVLPERWREIARLLDLMSLCGFLNASQQRTRLFDTARELIGRTIQ